jgi:hypothetical protein
MTQNRVGYDYCQRHHDPAAARQVQWLHWRRCSLWERDGPVNWGCHHRPRFMEMDVSIPMVNFIITDNGIYL